jgi:hypothetical protein
MTPVAKDFILRRLASIGPLRNLWAKHELGSLDTRIRFDAIDRPWYAYGVQSAALLAQRLGVPAISVVEFGVAGGRGLLVLERLAEQVGKATGIRIDTYGFDSGQGMPRPQDYRDLPHVWGEGDYRMDESALRARLKSAKLVLGEVGRTVAHTLGSGIPPIGFISFDLDYYSSTVAAFAIFDGPASTRLPRVHCYFDDICWPDFGCQNEFVGELLAIREFNDSHSKMKICPVAHLWTQRQIRAMWNEQIYVCHDFEHPHYVTNVAPRDSAFTQLPLPG